MLRAGADGIAQERTAGLQFSRRILKTDAPVISLTRRLMSLSQDVMSLAQGVTYWQPPPEARTAAVTAMANDQSIHIYGPCEGYPPLREALRKKLASKNQLQDYNVCVTHGANQAFVNLVLALVDPEDTVAVISPIYFDHIMTLDQQGFCNVLLAPCDPRTLHPDLAWLRKTLQGGQAPRMLVLCNPCNPTGVLLSKAELEEISELCRKAGTWLVIDNTYEDFIFTPGAEHHCPKGDHILHIFSFSKAYGMMGWRVGYIAYPDFDGQDSIGKELLKCQDTICICPTQLSQHIALACLQHGDAYVREHVESLKGNRELLLDALSPIGKLGDGKVAGGEGAIYCWFKLPDGWEDDIKAVEWLVKNAGVCLVPGSSCKSPGWVRASFGNLPPTKMPQAAERLKTGLQRMLAEKPPA